MRKIDIVIALFILAVGGFLVWRFFVATPDLSEEPTPSPSPVESIEDRVRSRFDIEIPDNAISSELVSVDGGEETGYASVYESEGEKMISIMADLSDIDATYSVYGVSESDEMLIGNLASGKGGYFGEFPLESSYSDIEIRNDSDTLLRGEFPR